MGVSRRMKTYDPSIEIVGVEPYLGHKIQGLKNMKEAYRPEIFDKNRLDRKINIEDEVAFEMTRRLALEEGLFVGMSSGAAMAIALEEASNMTEGTLVVILPDGGERYLSTALFTVRDKVELKLFNTMSRKKELFEPLVPGKVSMYSCGLTAHARIHLAECRRFVFSDLLRRYLDYRGYDVTHIMNITDLDDKTIDGSEKAGMELADFTRRHIHEFKNDLKLLGIKPAEKYPRASDHTGDMVSLSEKLVRKGVAYEKLRSIYFDISRFKEYGRLSGVDINKIRLGATVDLDEYEKDNPRDFTLLKRSKLSELKRGIYVKTDWGNVRPSWHLQCATMSMKYLGDSYDIHTASRELTFPHHENEIAIAGALTGKPLARFWIHCDRVLVDGKKMDETGRGIDDSASHGHGIQRQGNSILADFESLPQTGPVCPDQTRQAPEIRFNEWIPVIARLHELAPMDLPIRIWISYCTISGTALCDAMDDDLNISAALAAIFSDDQEDQPADIGTGPQSVGCNQDH